MNIHFADILDALGGGLSDVMVMLIFPLSAMLWLGGEAWRVGPMAKASWRCARRLACK